MSTDQPPSDQPPSDPPRSDSALAELTEILQTHLGRALAGVVAFSDLPDDSPVGLQPIAILLDEPVPLHRIASTQARLDPLFSDPLLEIHVVVRPSSGEGESWVRTHVSRSGRVLLGDLDPGAVQVPTLEPDAAIREARLATLDVVRRRLDLLIRHDPGVPPDDADPDSDADRALVGMERVSAALMAAASAFVADAGGGIRAPADLEVGLRTVLPRHRMVRSTLRAGVHVATHGADAEMDFPAFWMAARRVCLLALFRLYSAVLETPYADFWDLAQSLERPASRVATDLVYRITSAEKHAEHQRESRFLRIELARWFYLLARDRASGAWVAPLATCRSHLAAATGHEVPDEVVRIARVLRRL